MVLKWGLYELLRFYLKFVEIKQNSKLGILSCILKIPESNFALDVFTTRNNQVSSADILYILTCRLKHVLSESEVANLYKWRCDKQNRDF